MSNFTVKKVYVVERHVYYEGFDILGIANTRENAKVIYNLAEETNNVGDELIIEEIELNTPRKEYFYGCN